MKKTKKRSKVVTLPIADWEPLFQLQRLVRHKRRRDVVLGLQLIQKADTWTALAIETVNPMRVKGATIRDGVEAVFDNHSHQYLGDFDRLQDAFDEAEEYGRKWRTDALPKHDKCECGPIEGAGAIVSGCMPKDGTGIPDGPPKKLWTKRGSGASRAKR